MQPTGQLSRCSLAGSRAPAPCSLRQRAAQRAAPCSATLAFPPLGAGPAPAAAAVAAPAVQQPPRSSPTQPSQQPGQPPAEGPACQPPARWTGHSPHSAGVSVLSVVGMVNGCCKPCNQDAFVVQEIAMNGATATLLGVFDGHGTNGHVAAERTARSVATAVQQCAEQAVVAGAAESSLWWDYESCTNLSEPSALSADSSAAYFSLTLDSAQSCLQATFNKAAEELASVDDCDLSVSGATAVLCLVLPDIVVAAWAGDSRAVIGTDEGLGGYEVVQLTRDHKPTLMSEFHRITSHGGRVARRTNKSGQPIGPFRVCMPGFNFPGLSVARAFGDILLQRIGVVHTPDIAAYSRSPAAPPQHNSSAGGEPQRPTEVLVIATDGLWEMLSNREAVELAVEAGSPEAATRLLMEAAQARWARQTGGKLADDITVCVAYL